MGGKYISLCDCYTLKRLETDLYVPRAFQADKFVPTVETLVAQFCAVHLVDSLFIHFSLLQIDARGPDSALLFLQAGMVGACVYLCTSRAR